MGAHCPSPGTATRAPRPASGRSRSAASASSTATSAPARFTPSAKPSRRRVAGGAVTREAVLGVLSLIFWALIVIVTLKYVLILLRADNNGEGGTLTLMALAQRALGRSTPLLVLLGTISGALFYGDAVITPALSVLSAIEGSEDRDARVRILRGPADGADPDPAVRRAVARHRAGRGAVRTDHARLVHCDRDPRHPAASPPTRRCWPRSIRGTRCASSAGTA